MIKRLAAALVVTLPLAAAAQEHKTLSVGDVAPGIDIAHVFSGDDVKAFAEDRIYIVVFWGTESRPSQASVPHLAALQKRYGPKNVTVLALSDEPVETVSAFLEGTCPDGRTWSEAMAYTVATDPDGSAKAAIHTATGQRGIPSSFIIAKGKIQWIGHPAGLNRPIAEVVAGRWDPRVEEAFELAMEELGPRINEARADPEKSLAIFDELLAEFPTRVQLLDSKFKVLLLGMHRDDEAYVVARKIFELRPNDSEVQNQLAWTILDDRNVKTRDLDLAMELAVSANRLTKSKNAAILDTLARAHFEKGDIDAALSWQKKALSFAQGPRMVQELGVALERYKLAKAKKDAPKDDDDGKKGERF